MKSIKLFSPSIMYHIPFNSIVLNQSLIQISGISIIQNMSFFFIHFFAFVYLINLIKSNKYNPKIVFYVRFEIHAPTSKCYFLFVLNHLFIKIHHVGNHFTISDVKNSVNFLVKPLNCQSFY